MTFSGSGNIIRNATVLDGMTIGATYSTADPLLGAFGRYGGPTALPANSPARGIVSVCSAVDQRFAKRHSPSCDAGAFEYTARVLFVTGDGEPDTID